jgi:hypothetical protein
MSQSGNEGAPLVWFGSGGFVFALWLGSETATSANVTEAFLQLKTSGPPAPSRCAALTVPVPGCPELQRTG